MTPLLFVTVSAVFVAGFATGGAFVALLIPPLLRRKLAERDEQWELADLNARARRVGRS